MIGDGVRVCVSLTPAPLWKFSPPPPVECNPVDRAMPASSSARSPHALDNERPVSREGEGGWARTRNQRADLSPGTEGPRTRNSQSYIYIYIYVHIYVFIYLLCTPCLNKFNGYRMYFSDTTIILNCTDGSPCFFTRGGSGTILSRAFVIKRLSKHHPNIT